MLTWTFRLPRNYQGSSRPCMTHVEDTLKKMKVQNIQPPYLWGKRARGEEEKTLLAPGKFDLEENSYDGHPASLCRFSRWDGASRLHHGGRGTGNGGRSTPLGDTVKSITMTAPLGGTEGRSWGTGDRGAVITNAAVAIFAPGVTRGIGARRLDLRPTLRVAVIRAPCVGDA